MMNTQQGFILIAVLWICLLLSIFALNMSTKSRLAGVQAMNIQDMSVNTQSLYSGLAIGYHEYIKYRDNKEILEYSEEWESLAGQGLELWFPRFEPYLVEVGEDLVGVQIKNISGKLNINRVGLALLQEIIMVCGVSSLSEATSIANSILDWIDEDDLKRLGGAEKEYYLSLPRPYLPKNNQIEDIRELLLVQGVTRDILQGTNDHPGLVHFFSVHGDPERMDINSADPETFSVLGDISPDVVQLIVDARSRKPLSGLYELGDMLPPDLFGHLEEYYMTAPVRSVKITAFRVLADGELGRSVSRIFPTRD